MAFTLAHDYDTIQPLAERNPDDLESLDDLAPALWELEAPSLA